MSNDQIKLTSNDPIFDDIRPCRDDEVQSELKKIISDDLVLNSILKFRYPVAYKPFSFILKPLVKAYLAKKIKNIKTIRDFQLIVADFVKNMDYKSHGELDSVAKRLKNEDDIRDKLNQRMNKEKADADYREKYEKAKKEAKASEARQKEAEKQAKKEAEKQAKKEAKSTKAKQKEPEQEEPSPI